MKIHTAAKFLFIDFPLCFMRLVWFCCIWLNISKGVVSKNAKTREYNRNKIFWLKDFFLFEPHRIFVKRGFLSRRVEFLVNKSAKAALFYRDGSGEEIEKWRLSANSFFTDKPQPEVKVQALTDNNGAISRTSQLSTTNNFPRLSPVNIKLAGDLDIY